MKILKFKTNIENDEMLRKIAPALDQEAMISKWNLDTDHQDNILSVSGNDIAPGVVLKTIEENGFKAESIHVQGIGGHDL